MNKNHSNQSQALKNQLIETHSNFLLNYQFEKFLMNFNLQKVIDKDKFFILLLILDLKVREDHYYKIFLVQV